MFENWSHVEIWALFALLLWLAEVFVPGMILGCLGTGALGGLLAAWLGAGIEAQLIAASVASVLAFLFLRPLALNKWFRGAEVTTGVEALVGREAKVTVAFDAHSATGRCQVDGDDWLAQIEDTSPPYPQVGDRVRIKKTNSNTLIVTSNPPSS
jgi:membrane protein implicated in regulation of membrane protease activity